MAKIDNAPFAEAGTALRTFLFEDLFENATELAQLMAEASEGSFKQDSAYTAISLVLNGKRNPTDNFQEALVGAVKLKVAGQAPTERLRLVEEARRLLGEIERQTKRRAIAAAGLGASMGEASEVAKLKFIISPSAFLEGQTGTATHNPESRFKAMNVMANSIKLLSPSENPTSKMVLCYQSREDVWKMWTDLVAYGTQLWPRVQSVSSGAYADGDDEVKAVVDEVIARILSLEEAGFLRVYKIHRHYCLSPVVLYDPNRAHGCGFHIYFSGAELEGFPIPKQFFFLWRKFCQDFENSQLLDPAEAMPLGDPTNSEFVKRNVLVELYKDSIRQQ